MSQRSSTIPGNQICLLLLEKLISSKVAFLDGGCTFECFPLCTALYSFQFRLQYKLYA